MSASRRCVMVVSFGLLGLLIALGGFGGLGPLAFGLFGMGFRAGRRLLRMGGCRCRLCRIAVRRRRAWRMLRAARAGRWP